MQHRTKRFRTRWEIRKEAASTERQRCRMTGTQPSRPADTRPAVVYGLHVRNTSGSGSDTWASLVKSHRDLLSMTQKQLAELAGVGRETVWRWETGKYRPEDVETVVLVANALHIDQDRAMRAAGFAVATSEAPPEPPMWALARSLGLDPRDENVRDILGAGWSERTVEYMLREEKRLQDDDRRRRAERIRLAKEMYEGGVDQAAG